jgi:hypothetical protein
MRFDLPHELPISRDPDSIPLEPGPIERRRARLSERAAENRGPRSPLPRPDRPLESSRKREPRDRASFQRNDRHLDCRPPRRHLPFEAFQPVLRKEEQEVLVEVGRFRVIATRDLSETIYRSRLSRMERDMAFLRHHGLIEVNAVNARRDGRAGRVEHLEVVTLTQAGRNLVSERSGLAPDQKFYAGLVKPREVEHDTQIYRACRREAQRIRESCGRNLRVRLDFELKAQVQRAIYAWRTRDPNHGMNQIKQQVARQFDLPLVNNRIRIPDARIDYDLAQGAHSGHQDIEVLTAAYRPGHLRSKVQAGFHLYASARDRNRLIAGLENDHPLLQGILEL